MRQWAIPREARYRRTVVRAFAPRPVVAGQLGPQPREAVRRVATALHRAPDRVEGVPNQAPTEGGIPQFPISELRSGLQPGFVRLAGADQGAVVAHAEAAGELLVDPGAVVAVALDFEPLQVELLLGSELPPQMRGQAVRHEGVARRLHRVLDDPFDGIVFARAPLARELVGDVDVLNGAVLRQDAQCRGVGCELVVRVGEVRGLAVIEFQHRVELPLDLRLDLWNHLVEKRRLVGSLLAQHHQNRTLDVVACLERRFGLRGDGPRGCDAEARSPENQGKVGPHGRILVREHDDLEAIVRHVDSEIAVAVHHALAELTAGAFDGEGAFAIGIPIRKQFNQDVIRPRKQYFRELMVVYGIGVRRISKPTVATRGHLPCIDRLDSRGPASL